MTGVGRGDDDSVRWEVAPKFAALARPTINDQLCVVASQYVLYDGQPEARATLVAARPLSTRKNRSVSRGIYSASIPSPVSATIRSAPSAATRQVSVILAVVGVKRTALDSRFTMTVSISAALPRSCALHSASITILAISAWPSNVLPGILKQADTSPVICTGLAGALQPRQLEHVTKICRMRLAWPCICATGFTQSAGTSSSSARLSR